MSAIWQVISPWFHMSNFLEVCSGKISHAWLSPAVPISLLELSPSTSCPLLRSQPYLIDTWCLHTIYKRLSLEHTIKKPTWLPLVCSYPSMVFSFEPGGTNTSWTNLRQFCSGTCSTIVFVGLWAHPGTAIRYATEGSSGSWAIVFWCSGLVLSPWASSVESYRKPKVFLP